MLKKLLYSSALCLFVLATAGVAKADTIGPSCGPSDSENCLGSTYTLTYSNPSTNVYDIFLTVDTTGSTLSTSDTLNAVSLKLVSKLTGDTVTLLSAPSEWNQATPDVEAGGISAGGCNGSGKGYFCSGTSDSGVSIGSTGDVYNFEWEIDGSLTLLGSSSSIKASYLTYNAKKDEWKNAGITSAKIDLTPGSTPPVIPEPPSLLLLGTGLAALAGMLKLKSLA